jgi:endonuclease YncB( thermonuclease family)
VRRLAAALSLAGCAVGAGACQPRPSIYGDAASAELHEIKVEAGDRFEIDHQRVRLADAETPQPAAGAGCRAEAMIGAHVIEVVRSTLTGARHLEVHPARGGHFGLVNVDGLDLGQMLIREGLAVARGPTAMDWCLPRSTGGQQDDEGR